MFLYEHMFFIPFVLRIFFTSTIMMNVFMAAALVQVSAGKKQGSGVVSDSEEIVEAKHVLTVRSSWI